jgi:tetratricopeptide (TPR) repeat protein
MNLARRVDFESVARITYNSRVRPFLLALICLGTASCSKDSPIAVHYDGEVELTPEPPKNRDIPDATPKVTESSNRFYREDEMSRLAKVSEGVRQEQQDLRENLEKGNYEEALKNLEVVDQAFRSAGVKIPHHAFHRAEALLGLGKLDEAKAALDAVGTEAKRSSITLLIEALEGELTAAEARDYLDLRSESYSSDNWDELTLGLGEDRVAAVRLARAIDANFEDRLDSARMEALAVLSRVKDQPLAAYIAADTYALQGKHMEAKEYWEVAASSLSGLMGNRARQGAQAAIRSEQP